MFGYNSFPLVYSRHKVILLLSVPGVKEEIRIVFQLYENLSTTLFNLYGSINDGKPSGYSFTTLAFTAR